MQFIQDYEDDDIEKKEEPKLLSLNKPLAPPVVALKESNLISPVTKELAYNPKFNELYTPVMGPENPNPKPRVDAVVAQETHLNDFIFEQQYQEQEEIDTKLSRRKRRKGLKRKKEFSNDPSADNFMGPWAPYEQIQPEEEDVEYVYITPEEEAQIDEARRLEKEERETKKLRTTVTETSIYHLDEFYDYQGRTFVNPPSHIKPGHTRQNYLPNKLTHTWTGHSKGISCIKFFPKYGHLLLSASMDMTVKIWDVVSHKKCVRTYIGHEKAIRGVAFNHDGRKFSSCSYDSNLRVWDTETGQVINTLNNGKIPYCSTFHPSTERDYTLMAGYNDKKILQWDLRSNKIVQKYDQHLGAVNTITFIDENRRFVSSSDDKTLRIWEFGIPVVIKYIADPHMHSMPSIALHPGGRWFAAQSLDNQILVYETRDRFKMHKKKRFTGHVIAGYACQVNFSNDGKFLMSGDAEGKLWFWDWATNKKIKTMKAHDGVLIGCEWHPIDPSRLVTCGWDGTIKMFE